jgi:hypothetical protein
MPYIITSDDPHDIIALFVASRFDHHVRAYRQHRFVAQIAADAARPLDDMSAGLRALRSRKLFETETSC